VFTLDTFGVLHVIAYKVSPHIAVFVSVSENGILRECTIASTLYADITDTWHQTSLKRPKHRVFEKGRREAFSDSLLVSGMSSKWRSH
jgi:hypothetical protein